jgi:hypothetical protein
VEGHVNCIKMLKRQPRPVPPPDPAGRLRPRSHITKLVSEPIFGRRRWGEQRDHRNHEHLVRHHQHALSRLGYQVTLIPPAPALRPQELTPLPPARRLTTRSSPAYLEVPASPALPRARLRSPSFVTGVAQMRHGVASIGIKGHRSAAPWRSVGGRGRPYGRSSSAHAANSVHGSGGDPALARLAGRIPPR